MPVFSSLFPRQTKTEGKSIQKVTQQYGLGVTMPSYKLLYNLHNYKPRMLEQDPFERLGIGLHFPGE